MSVFADSWARAWSALALQPAPSLQGALLRAWGEAQRHYHTQQHLQECLAHFAGARHLATHPGEVEIALWFHDAIYEVKASDNEAHSADWADAALTQAQAPAEVRQRVRELIMATCHSAQPEGAEAQLVVDIDLAILGAAPERFAQYDAQVREEYAWVPGLVYRMKRKAVLKGFLARKRIYGTAHFHERLEAQARANLTQAVRGQARDPADERKAP